MQRVRDHLILLGQAVFVLCIVLILANFKPIQREYSTIPVKGDKGDAGIVDYERVTEIVQTEVAALPIPKDGKNGLNGKDADPVDYGALHTFIQQQVQAAFDALNNPPEPELEFEYRDNPNNGTREWRLVGDDSWRTCQPEDNCP